MSEKLTPWFPGTVKPVHEGVYQRDYGDPIGTGFSRFDGRKWFLGFNDPEEAAASTIITTHPNLPWRGLAQDPSKEKA